MVSAEKTVQYINGVACVITTYWGVSTDSKPTDGVGNGSRFVEMDASKLFVFDAENGVWWEWGA